MEVPKLWRSLSPGGPQAPEDGARVVPQAWLPSPRPGAAGRAAGAFLFPAAAAGRPRWAPHPCAGRAASCASLGGRDLGDFPLRRAPQPLGTTLPDPAFSGNTSPLPPTARPGQRAAEKEIGREGIGREGDAVPGASGWGEELCDSQPAADSDTPKGAHPHPKRRPPCTPGPAAPS